MVQINQHVLLSFFFAKLVLDNSQKAFGIFWNIQDCVKNVYWLL